MTSNSNNSNPNYAQKYSDPAEKPYFYGRLLREEANKVLEKRGSKDGLFLLRESVFEVGSYILSLCCNRTIQHYKIERYDDGTVGIGRNGHRFIGPIELIKYHQVELSGLLIRPTIPCNRSDEGQAVVQPIKYLFIHDVDLYKLVSNEIKNQLAAKIKQKNLSKDEVAVELENAKGRFRYKYEKIVLKNIHFTQTWFLKGLGREEATRLLRDSGLENGKFLVRSNPSSSKSSINNNNNNNNLNSSSSDNNSSDNNCEYKISLCYNGEVKHYQIKTKFISCNDNTVETRYYIDDSFEFDTIIQLVDYFHRCSVGFLCNLRIAYLPLSTLNTLNPNVDGFFRSKSKTDLEDARKSATTERNIYNSNRMYNAVLNDSNTKSGTINYIDDEPNNSGDIANLNNIPEKKRSLFENEENYEYRSLHKYSKLDTIEFKNLSVFDKLGTGCFASVYRGIYKLKVDANNNHSESIMQEIPVAIKKLNLENLEDSKNEIEKEAELMRSLNNPFIIKFIGMCFNYPSSSIMIVLELAKLGPLHKYLRAHQEMSMFKIIKICYQVSIAMSYLAEKKLIHRDLAARNVLLVSEDIAKVSDFGLSRRMNEFNCYETHAHGKWPLKWYPPDATLGKFDEKSDVWSFGVTCWEATSYGARPYQGIEISTLIISLQNGHRLGKPSKCPDEIYNIMLKCWHADKHLRPNFKIIREELKQAIFELYQTYINYQ